MRYSTLILIGSLSLLFTACATGDEWATWRQHPSHFASTDHLGFSVRNREGRPALVRREDISRASTQG